MKTIQLILIFILFYSYSFSQINSKNQIDISAYILVNDVFRFSEIDGAGWADNGEGFRFGLNYNRKIYDKVWINSGINFLYTSNVYHNTFDGPTELQIIQSQRSQIVQIPARVKYDILKWLYIKGGLTFDYQFNNSDGIHIDNQTGIGCSLLCGIDLKVLDMLYFNIEPEFGLTSLIPFNADDFQQHFLLTGINLNLGFRF